MNKELSNELGVINISQEVIATIAGVAATECYGIVGMASRKLKDGIAELLGREALSKGVKVFFEDGDVVIELYIIAAYGINISKVAANVIDKVKYNIENLTGLTVKSININVQGVLVKEES